MTISIRQRHALSYDIGLIGLTAAVRKATEMGIPSSVAVVDESGQLNSFARLDDAALMTIDIAKDKAYTAAAFGMATQDWFDFMKQDEAIAAGAPTGIRRLIVFGGGLPIQVDGAVIGGIGVSGGHWRDDITIATAGIEAILAALGKATPGQVEVGHSEG